MTLNERILDFMDGTLPAEDEAELLHILSVSPEHRNLLRSFMNQAALFTRDRQSIQVPYLAEQKLWERLGPLMPVLPALESATTVESASPEAAVIESTRNRIAPVPVSFFSRVFTMGAAALGTVTLVLGLGLGYLAGADQSPIVRTVYLQNKSVSEPTTAHVDHADRSSLTSMRTSERATSHMYSSAQPTMLAASVAPQSFAPQSFEISNPAQNQTPDLIQLGEHVSPVAATTNQDVDYAAISTTTLRNGSHATLRDIGGEDGIKPILMQPSDLPNPTKSLLERFEFSFTESFGRQYPNSIETNTTLPIITNSAVGAFFQVLPRSDAFWIGATYGTANITRKNLTTSQDPLDPLQTVLSSDTVHAPTSYIAGFVQYRMPIIPSVNMTMTAGYGLASIGKMYMGELGVHYDVSKEVGLQVGLRALEFHYDLTQQFNDAISSGNSSLVIAKGVGSASPSYNLELNTGLFFHF